MNGCKLSAVLMIAMTLPACDEVSDASDLLSGSSVNSGSPQPPPLDDDPVAVTCQGSIGWPQPDGTPQPKATLVLGPAANGATLTFQGWSDVPDDQTLALSCTNPAPSGRAVRVMCATLDHGYWAEIVDKTATVYRGQDHMGLGSLTCDRSVADVPQPPADDSAKINVGRYRSWMPSPSDLPGVCTITEELTLDKTVVGGQYTAAVFGIPGPYCTPADLRAKQDRIYKVTGAVLEQCHLRIVASDGSGNTLEIRDGRLTLPPTDDPAQPSCASQPGDLNVTATGGPRIEPYWSQIVR